MIFLRPVIFDTENPQYFNSYFIVQTPLDAIILIYMVKAPFGRGKICWSSFLTRTDFFFSLPDYYNLNLLNFRVNSYLPHMSPDTAPLKLYFYIELLLSPIDGEHHSKNGPCLRFIVENVEISAVSMHFILNESFITWSNWHYLQDSQYVAIPSPSVYSIRLGCGLSSHFFGHRHNIYAFLQFYFLSLFYFFFRH